jgi:hypothetical protein
MVLAAFAGFASAANAASVVMTADKNFVGQGETITLHGVVTSSGAEADNTVFGAITYQDQFLNTNIAGNSQVGLPGWATSLGALTCTTTRCISFSQSNVSGILPVPGGVTSFQISTTTFIVAPTTPMGTVLTFNWQTTPFTQRLDYFGVTNAPGVTVTVIGSIPEPTTAAMLGLGLFGLALAGRRRSWRRRRSTLIAARAEVREP